MNEVSADKLVGRLHLTISQPLQNALDVCLQLCQQAGVQLFLVGGAVRDLLAGREHLDLDLCVETDVAPLAQGLARRTLGEAVIHPRFGTATVHGAGFHLDIARSRRETYAHPGALPEVEPAPLLDDLARRDFTVNAMALNLGNRKLIDPFGGRADLAAGLVRALHEASFRDDPTRSLRAARYAARMQLRLETATQVWMTRDLPFLGAVSGPRLRRELALIFAEEAAPEATSLLARLGVLTALSPHLHLSVDLAERWQAVQPLPLALRDELGFCLIANPVSSQEVAAISDRLHLLGRLEKCLQDLVRLRAASDKLKPDEAVEACDILDGARLAAVQALALLDTGMAGQACRNYLAEWRFVRPQLKGPDLEPLGVAPGATIGEILRRLRRHRLAGNPLSREDEMALVKDWITNGGV